MNRPVAVIVDPDGRVGIVARFRFPGGATERKLVLLEDCNAEDLADVRQSVLGFLFTVSGPLRHDVVPIVQRRPFAELDAGAPVSIDSVLGRPPAWARR